MKVVAFNGSPRAEGNTARLIKIVFKELEREGIKTQLVNLGKERLQGCTACLGCAKAKDRHCVLLGDKLNDYIDLMLEADGIILGSPVYCSDMTANLKALVERASFVGKMNQDMLQRKVGAAVVAVRRGGACHTFSSINYFFTILQMIVVGSSYWNFGMGLQAGEVEQDEEGVQTMVNLGKNMAWVLKKING
jgi:multimeric flavodoxin WrbA